MHVWPMPADRVDAELARVEAVGQPRVVEEELKHGEVLRQAGKVARVQFIALAKL
ncbi:hypothetical protein [Halomonas elongata]|uniref:hypothetical protein n=1 Tax=Halomonas elongata TaxID=2746 RepID=UPI00186B5DB2|nr:hypothetical protein [Halomonas elongata]MBW5799755.1 hypothetical protein [Halomonas elongata]